MVKLKHHTGLTLERWCKFTLFEQLANVGTDVARIINWRKRGDMEQSNLAFERVLELMYLTIADPKNKKRLKELLRVRETLIDYFMYDNIYGSSDQLWLNYFDNYCWAAALQRGR